MNRTLILLLALVMVVGAAVGMTLYLRSASTPASTTTTTQPVVTPITLPDTPPPSQQTTQSVQAAFAQTIPASNPDNTKLTDSVISGNYALQVWKGDNYGGEALLKYDAGQGKWVVVTRGGGAWNIADLVAKGVPPATATALWKGLPH